MTKPGSKDGSLRLTLSSFWQRLFRDDGHLEGIYKALEILLGQVYRESLEHALSISIEKTPVFGKDYWRELFLIESDRAIRVTPEGTEYAFELDEDIVDFRYLQDRITTPERVLEAGRDFDVRESSSGGKELVFLGGNPFDIEEIPRSFIAQEPVAVVTGSDGFVDFGRPNEHLSILTATRVVELATRYALRSTFTTSGIRFESRTAEFLAGQPTWIYLKGESFSSAEVVGKTLRGYHGLIPEDRTILFVPQADVLVISAAFDSGFDGPIAEGKVQLIDLDTFQAEHVGFDLVVVDNTNPSNSGIYSIAAVNNGLSVELERAFSFDVAAQRTMSSCTLVSATRTFSVPTLTTQFRPQDVGKAVYASDASGNGSFFQIESVGSLNASGFALTVVVKDPAALLGSFDLSGILLSRWPSTPSSVKIDWIVRTPSVVRRAQFYAPDVVVDRKYLSDRYGAIIDRAGPSSEGYKRFLQGVYQYFWVGPTHFALESALNTMVGLPVIANEGEILLRVEQTATKDLLVTDQRSYELPPNFLKADLLEASAIRTKVFKKLEALSDAFVVEDFGNNPAWMYQTTVPSTAMPLEPDSRRLVDPNVKRTVFDGSWILGDPGISVGTAADGIAYPDGVIEFSDAFIVGTALTTDSTKLTSTYAGKPLHIEGRLRQASVVPTDQTITLNEPLDALLVAHFNPTADLSGATITILTYEFTTAKDLGRPIDTSLGVHYIASVLGTHTATLVDGVGTPMAAAPVTEVVQIAYSVSLINRVPMHATVGLIAGQALVGPNTFSVRYDLNSEHISFETLQDDITDIIAAGRPAHTFFFNFPFTSLVDTVYVGDGITQSVSPVLGLGSGAGDMAILSRPLRLNGAWQVGDLFFLNSGYVTWERRLAFAEMTSLPLTATDIDGNPYHNVFDAGSATEVWFNLVAENAAETYALDIYAWNGTSFVPTGESIAFDTSSPAIEVTLIGGVLLAFLVTASTGTEVALQIGARRDSVSEKVNIAHHPTGTGTIAIASDIMTDAAYDFFDLEVGREMVLEYDVAGTPVYEQVRIIARTGLHTVQLVYKSTNLAFAPTVNSIAVAWSFTAQRRWGQTPLILGGQDPSVRPYVGAPAGAGFSVELPVQVRIID